ncbi:SLC13 family permease [Gryllotalpicola protaetiae]|uniref:SLC13 family permease n=1 Tax=Gryllotalpicola protaetiae TaxID=2419771 RepID=A0A387BMQ6_9MICO|nr:SLC13 family permease [Gryllotalpicola protaetiae]AYG02296.1 SLC13 family permease [Gryllotalpicola protaetiae]
MNTQLLIVLVLLAAAITMFAIGRPRMDVVAVLMIVGLPLTGVLTVPETLAGFADPNVVLIGALFVVGEALSRTGITYRLGDWLARAAGTSSTRLLVLLMVSVGVLGAVMSSTGVVAIFIPVVLSIAKRLGVSPRRLMMPLSFAALISGMLTLIATAPNLVVDAELRRAGHAGFGFFSITPFGLVILALGVVYMLFARRFLGGADEGVEADDRTTFPALIEKYGLASRERRLRVGRRSPLIGTEADSAVVRRQHGIRVLAVERSRWGQKQLTLGSDPQGFTIKAGDVLLVDVADTEDPQALARRLDASELPLGDGVFVQSSRELGLAEIILPPNSGALGRTVAGLRMRDDHDVDVIGIRHGADNVSRAVSHERLRLGDTLLVVGSWEAIRRLAAPGGDFIALELPVEVEERVPAGRRAPLALLSLAVMIVLMVTGIVPNVVAALIACLLMGVFGCIDMTSAYRAIHWPTLLLIVGMLPFALALDKTGGIDLVASGLADSLGGAAPTVILAGIFIVTAVIGLFVSNTATAVLMAPVAIGIASHLHASPYPFAMVVALAASAAFVTPVSSPVNTLVLDPGRYRFGDFVKVGAPFAVVVLLVAVFLVPVILPLHP